MHTFRYLRNFFLMFVIVVPAGAVWMFGETLAGKSGQEADKVSLQSGWQIQSSCLAAEKGDTISSTAFTPRHWFPAHVPGPVVTNLVAAKVKEYPDPYTGMNLRKMPGVSYPVGGEFSNLPIPEDSPFHCSWWYRISFPVAAAKRGRQNWLNFQGINYRANVWLNGKQIADSKQIAGAFRTYELNVAANLAYGKTNVLAVEVFAPSEDDLGITFVDWNPMPPDKNMGLWREVFLSTTGAVALRHPFVDTRFHSDSHDVADLTVYADVKNGTEKSVRGSVEVAIEGVKVAQGVELAPGESREVSFGVRQYPHCV